jgi:hypothetical protein
MRTPSHFLLSAVIIGFMAPSSWGQLITNTPALTGPGLPAGLTHNVYAGSGYASVGVYQGRDSLLIGTTGFGNVLSWVAWDLANAFSGPVTEGTFKFSIYDAYGGASSPYYMHVQLDAVEKVASFNWDDAGWGNPNFGIGGPNLNAGVSRPRSIGWQNFELTWNSSAVTVTHNGLSILSTTRKTNASPSSVNLLMHNYYGGSQQMALSGLSVVGVPEPTTYALLAMSAASALWWARRRN